MVVVACQEIVSTDRPRSPQSDDRKHWFQTPAATKRCNLIATSHPTTNPWIPQNAVGCVMRSIPNKISLWSQYFIHTCIISTKWNINWSLITWIKSRINIWILLRYFEKFIVSVKWIDSIITWIKFALKRFKEKFW